jgi:predicted ribosomally synthesized peptide with nif11-like leader
MSHQAFEAFIKKLQQDGSLRKELSDQLGDLSQGVKADELNEFAATRGYDFKVQEIRDELTDQQLDSAAGGITIGGTQFHKVETSPLGATFIKIDLGKFRR